MDNVYSFYTGEPIELENGNGEISITLKGSRIEVRNPKGKLVCYKDLVEKGDWGYMVELLIDEMGFVLSDECFK